MERAISDFVCTPTTYLLCKKIFAGEEYIIPPLLDPKVIVDIGANVGAMTVHLRGKYPDATIYAIEPSSESFSLLKLNTEGMKDIHLFNVAALGHYGEATLLLGRDGLGTSSLHYHRFSSTEVETVKTVSTMMLLAPLDSISLLKIDTEGCEVPILSDLYARLPYIDAILIEYHSEEDRHEIDAFLAKTHLLYAARADQPHRGVLTYISHELAEQHHLNDYRIAAV